MNTAQFAVVVAFWAGVMAGVAGMVLVLIWFDLRARDILARPRSMREMIDAVARAMERDVVP